jgi:hypothetical protein
MDVARLASAAPSERFRLSDAARYLRISEHSLASARWRRLREIPTLRIGRALLFDRAELDCWLEANRERPRPGSAA